MVTPQDFFDLGRRSGQWTCKSHQPTATFTSPADRFTDDEDDLTSTPTLPLLLEGDVRTIVASLQPKHAAVTLPPGTAYLVFDTETTGRSKKSVVCQMAMAFVNAEHKILCMYNKIWKLPRGRFMSKGSMKVHGITPLQIRERGVWPASEMAQLDRTFKAAIAAKLPIVAFNANFDNRLLRQTAEALGLRSWTLELRHLTCTCSRSRVHSDLRNAKGARKGFTNAELYYKLFKRTPDGDLHDAATDVVVTACTYAMGCQKRWW